ncbi:MAG: two-component regulator propeller domain-containing protein [Ferruginibacter sp.]
MKNKKNVLHSLLILLGGLMHLPVHAQEKHGSQDSVFYSSPAQNPITLSRDSFKLEAKDAVISQVPNSMVRNVKQDRNGNILIASFTGVFRYDGKSFTDITSTIPSPSFWDVLEDRKGNLWFGTRDSGVYYYNGKSFRHFTTKDGLANNAATDIYEDRAGNIWFSTGGGISRYDGRSFQNFTTNDERWNNQVTTIMEDKTGKLWIGTRGETLLYDGKKFTAFTNKDGESFNNVWAIIEDKKGNIWLGGSILKDRKGDTLFSEYGLWRYDGNSITKVSDRGVAAMIQDRKGNIWTTGAVNPPNGKVWALSSYDQRYLYSKEPAVTEIMSIKGTGMLCGILEAKDGSIWFGSMGPGGVYRYDGKTITDFKSKEEE